MACTLADQIGDYQYQDRTKTTRRNTDRPSQSPSEDPRQAAPSGVTLRSASQLVPGMQGHWGCVAETIRGISRDSLATRCQCDFIRWGSAATFAPTSARRSARPGRHAGTRARPTTRPTPAEQDVAAHGKPAPDAPARRKPTGGAPRHITLFGLLPRPAVPTSRPDGGRASVRCSRRNAAGRSRTQPAYRSEQLGTKPGLIPVGESSMTRRRQQPRAHLDDDAGATAPFPRPRRSWQVSG